MFLIIVLFPWTDNIFVAICLLLLVGFMGGVFIIPMNTVLQDEGKRMVGSGKTIAIQNFIENLLMAVGSGIYYLITYIGISISGAIVGQGLLLLGFLMYLVKYRRRIVR